MRHLTLPDSNVTSAKTKLPQQATTAQQAIPAQQANKHAGATDSQIRPDKNRSFCPSAAKTNGSSPLSRPEETIIRAALPIRAKYRPNCPSRTSENAKNRSLCPAGAKTSDSPQFTPRGQHTPRFAPAFNLREAATEPGAPAPPWGRAAANRPPLAHRGPCPWPNARRAPGAAQARALPHPGHRAWCEPP